MFRCWQRGLCSSSSTRDSPQGTAGPLSHVRGALMKIHSRKGPEHQKRRDQQRAWENKIRERRGGRGREWKMLCPGAGHCQRGSGPWSTHTTAKENRNKEQQKNWDTLTPTPEPHFASLKGPTVPCGGYKAGKRGVWSEAEAGKGGGMDSPKRFNVCVFVTQ